MRCNGGLRIDGVSRLVAVLALLENKKKGQEKQQHGEEKSLGRKQWEVKALLMAIGSYKKEMEKNSDVIDCVHEMLPFILWLIDYVP